MSTPPTAAPDAPGEAMGERRVTTEVMARLREGFEYHLKTYAHIPDDDQLFMWPRVDPALGLCLLDSLAAMTAERDAATRERDRLREAVEDAYARLGTGTRLRLDHETWQALALELIDRLREALYSPALTAPAPTRDGGGAE